MSSQGKDYSVLSPARRELLALMLKKKGVKAELAGAIPKRDESGPCPLSFAQERIWFFETLEPGTAVYNIASAMRVTGRLNLSALQQSLDEVVRRHEILRTVFTSQEDRAVQVILPAEPLSLPVKDLSLLEFSERDAQALILINEESQRPFDLATGPLLRCTVLRPADEEHVVILCTHHIASDGWSMNVLIKEMATLYEAYSTGTSPALPDLTVQYADFAKWQRDWLQGQLLEEQLAYWKAQLAGAPPALNLATDCARPSIQTFRGAHEALSLSPSLSYALRELSRQLGVTLFMLMLAAFKALLNRYSGQDDILIGTPIANRSRVELENLIGFFANTLVLRTSLAGDPSFVELLQRVREASMGAYAHQDLPFEKLVQELQPERVSNRSPLFQVMFAMQNNPVTSIDLPGIKFTPLENDRATAKFDLFLGVADGNQGISTALEYNTDLFDKETAQQLLANLATLLESVVARPESRLSELSILSAADKRDVLTKWNQTQADYDRELTVATLFEQQAARVPDRIAVEFENNELTYRELNYRANQLAHYLTQLGVGPEVLVGICVDRSLEMMIGLLGVLKAGGAYVPLDPAYPRERLAFMMRDARVKVLLALARTSESVPADGITLVRLDADWQEIAQQRKENPEQPAVSDNLAYVIYTSGSTGTPKGVQISNAALVNFLHSMVHEPGLTEHDSLLAVTTLSFDIAALELYLPLIAGARLVLTTRDTASDGAWLHKKLESVTVMQATPTTWRLILDSGWRRQLPVKALCGGEMLPRGLANQLLDRSVSLWNMYGPTETTIWSSLHQVSHGDGPVPIGHPIANTAVYMLERTLEPAPVGVFGELFIGGDGVARGYWQRPELTAERFVPDPFSAKPGSRMYRTGDLARYRHDGTIEFGGRVDEQLKVYGHRIEPGEIESVLAQHPAVQESVVMAVDDEMADKRLVAYVVPNGQLDHSLIPELRSFAKERLPKYLLPALYVVLDAMPLTPNGKVDRKALPAPDRSRAESEEPYLAPRNAIEEKLAAIWSEVLKVKQVGVNDNFFELGGDSILGIQMIARANRAGLPYKPAQLFQHQSIASLAAALDGFNDDGFQQEREPALIDAAEMRIVMDHLDSIVEDDVEAVYPLSPAQEGILFHSLETSDHAVYVLQLSCTFRGLSIEAIEHAWHAVIQRHEVLRTAFVWEKATRPLQVVLRQVETPWTRLDWRDHEEATRNERFESYLEQDRNRGFSLSNAPLLRLSLIQTGDDAFRFVWTYHHLLLDGWAIFVVLKEFFQFYDAFSTGQELQLETPRPYREYISWLERQDLSSAKEFWRSLLQGFSEPTPLIRSRVDSLRSPGIDEYRILLPAELLEELQQLARQHQLTLNTLVQGAWALILAHESRRRDVVFGVTGSGRPAELPGIESMVGIFLNVLPVRVKLDSEEPLWNWLQQLQQQQFAARRFDYARLVQVQRWSDVPRGLPLFESILSFENYPIDDSLNVYTNTLALEDVRNYSKTNYPITLIVAPRGVLSVRLLYDRRRFDAANVARVVEMFSTLLRSFTNSPDARLKTLEDILLQAEQQQRLREQQQNEEAKRSKFKAIKPRPVSLPSEAVKKSTLAERVLVIEPAVEHVNLVNWIAGQRKYLETELLKYGAVLLRGFNVGSVQSFEAVAAAISPQLFGEYGDLPREGVGGKVYGSTPYPADQPILFHNESSHLPRWPMKIWFHCLQAARQGGETPIVDCRRIYQRLAPEIRERFARKKLMYVRNYIEGLDVSWQSFFKTSDPAAAEEACRQAGIAYEWLGTGTFKTRQICQAIAEHPVTGEAIFFNQLQLHHVSCLEPAVRETLLSMYARDELPRNVYYGDGSEIEDSLMDELCELYRQNSISFPWQAGDVLMLDNMLTAHGRNPFVGPRRIVVAMAEMFGTDNAARTAVTS